MESVQDSPGRGGPAVWGEAALQGGPGRGSWGSCLSPGAGQGEREGRTRYSLILLGCFPHAQDRAGGTLARQSRSPLSAGPHTRHPAVSLPHTRGHGESHLQPLQTLGAVWPEPRSSHRREHQADSSDGGGGEGVLRVHPASVTTMLISGPQGTCVQSLPRGCCEFLRPHAAAAARGHPLRELSTTVTHVTFSRIYTLGTPSKDG